MNKHAQALGRLARGKRKHITAKRRAQLIKQLVKAREKRWEKIKKKYELA